MKKKRTWRKRIRHAVRRWRNHVLVFIGPILIRLWIGSIRFRVSTVGMPCPVPGGRPVYVYAFWHQRMLAFAYTHRRTGVRILISSHGDGDLIARIVEKLGLCPVRGSSTRGGSQALRELERDLGSGFDYAFTPDGPRGPRHHFQIGAVYFASKSGRPIIAGTAAYRRAWKLPTWDQFVIPRPFTRGIIHGTEPIQIPPGTMGEELEEWRQKIEERLRQITTEAEERFEELYRTGQPLGDMYRRPNAPPAEPEG